MTIELREFYGNWLTKADQYDGNQLSDHFDKFTSLYVVYNSLYMEVMNRLHFSGKNIPENFKDKKAAVDYVIQYLKSKNFLTKLLSDQESNHCLQTLIELIDNEEFYIVLNWGQRQREKDIILAEDLRSNNKQAKACGILTLFYNIRCNMFHGHKGFVPYQENLLVPTNYLLRKTVEIIYNKLDE